MSASQENACLKRMTPSPERHRRLDQGVCRNSRARAPALALRGRTSTANVCSKFRRYIAPVLGQIFKQSIPNKQGEHV